MGHVKTTVKQYINAFFADHPDRDIDYTDLTAELRRLNPRTDQRFFADYVRQGARELARYGLLEDLGSGQFRKRKGTR